MPNVWVLLRRHRQVGLLELLTIHSVLVEGQIVERLLFVQVSATFSKLRGKGSKNVIDTVCANHVKDTI